MDGDLRRDPAALGLANVLGPVDRDRHHRDPGLERQPAEPRLGLAEVLRARAASLCVHEHHAPPRQNRVSSDERLVVPLPAPHWKRAAVAEDEVEEWWPEELRLGHELHLAAE